MTNAKSTKKALMLSILSLVLCVSMLIGTTFAWFTDSVTSANNIIKSGNLDVELYYQKQNDTEWTKVTETTNVFGAALWEPGHTEVVKLKVVNEGTLALKYQLGVNVASEVGSINVNDEPFKLSDFIKFGIVDDAQSYTRDEAVAAVDANATALKTAYKSVVTSLEAKNDGDTDENFVTMVVYMPTTVGNEANAKTGAAVPTINLGINLFATQYTAEEDSFGSDYDGEAVYQVFVDTADDLQAAVDAAVPGTEIILDESIALDAPIVIPAAQATFSMRRSTPAPIVIDLNGKTITTSLVEGSTTNHLYAFENHGNLVITGNGTINARGIFNYGNMVLENGTINAIDGNGGYAVRNYDGATFTMNGGTIATTFEDDHKVNNGGYDATTLRVDEGAYAEINGGTVNNICDWTFAIDNEGTLVVNDGIIKSVHSTVSNYGTLTVNGGSFTCDGLEGVTAHALVAWDGSTTTVNGGTFDGKDNYNGFNVDTEKGANVVINGGNFLPVHSGSLYGEGNITVMGGVFFDAVSGDRLAEGFTCTQKADGKWVVAVSDLQTVINNANAGDTIVLNGDVTATSVIMIDKDIVIEGNDYKVSSTATRVFRVTTSDVEVTLNNVNMVSNAVRVSNNDIRGISVDGDLTNISLTLNDCSVDFTDASAHDWSYAVNVVGGTGYTVIVNGGVYEGANVINIRGAGQTVVVKNATLNSLYQPSSYENMFGACIYVVQHESSSLEAVGNTFNGGNAVAINAGYTPVVESDNVDNTTRA